MSLFRRFLRQDDAESAAIPISKKEQVVQRRIRWKSAIFGQHTHGSSPKAHHIGLCDRCSRISWEDLFDRDRSQSVELPIYNVPPEKLTVVACQLCQFVGDTLNHREFYKKTDESTLPYALEDDWFPMPYIGGITHLQIRQLPGHLASPWAKIFIVMSNQEIQASTQNESLSIGKMPLRFIKQSIANCQEDHKGDCLPNDGKQLSSLKVYDCETRKVICAPPNCEYVALSYVWGSGKNHVTFGIGNGSSAVPKAVDDSIRVTLGLGYKFLWVDRYCIDQGNHGEKLEQISQMAEIYACAQLTIIAAAGEDANRGLPNLMHVLETPDLLSLEKVTLLRYPQRSAKSTLFQTTWASRAWTFQECYFSKRRLIILEHQAVYICNKDAAKIMPQGWYTSLHNDDAPGHEIRRSKDMIEAYCGREMTYESDALLAIIGALNTCDERAVRHIWGLPCPSEDQLPGRIEGNQSIRPALLWKHTQPCSRRNALPSWSPMAWTDKISWCRQSFPYTWEIQTLANRVSPQNSGVTPNNSDDLNNQPCWLQITAEMSPFRIVRIYPMKEDSPQATAPQEQPQRVCLAIPLSKEIDLISHVPCWDVDPSTIDLDKPILGILFEDSRERDAFRQSCILLVQWSGEFHERVGILPLTYPSPNVYRHFTHQARYIRWLDKRTGCFEHLEICDRDRHIYHDHPVYHMYNRNELSFFERKTIVLG